MVLSIVSSAPWTQIERTLRTTDFIRNGKNNNPIRNPNTIVSTISPTLIRNDYSIVKSAKTSNALKHNNTNNVWIHKREISTAHLGISFRIGGMYTRERFQWIVLNQILSGTLSARLFTILREENGLTYTSNTEIKFYESVGSFTIYAETEKSKLFKNGKKPGVLPLCVKFVEDLYRDGITEEELRRAQGYLAGTHIQDAEDGEEIVEYNGFREMFEMKDKSEYPMVEYKDFYKVYLEPVTKKEVDDLIKKWLEPSKMVLRIVSENI
jgi:predicted Zn-dependent peptidase